MTRCELERNAAANTLTMMASPTKAPKWHYDAPTPKAKAEALGIDSRISHLSLPDLEALDMGSYRREIVSNVDSLDAKNMGRTFFDIGLRHTLAYQHELASSCFLACLHYSPYCVLAHACLALCHSPNYNFKGEPYYNSTDHADQVHLDDHEFAFPSQQLAERHSRMAVEKTEELRKLHRQKSGGKKKKGKGRKPSPPEPLEPGQPQMITDVESHIVAAVRVLTCNPGVDEALAEELVGHPYADAMRKVYSLYPNDVEVVYFFAEALMVMNAWELYEYPTGQPRSEDVVETRLILETALEKHPNHAGLCHMYVHLSEMSSDPGRALKACIPLRSKFPCAGHLIHMPTHIDVLMGDYESCVRYNNEAILADNESIRHSPATAGTVSFYFGYIVHNYHMLVYGAILGGMEGKAMEIAKQLNEHLTEDMFMKNQNLTAYLESYSALVIHVMVRFGRWKEILELEAPRNKYLMLFRSSALIFARGLAHSNLGDIAQAKKEADRFDSIRKDPLAEEHILHNNSVSALLAVDAPMLRGEIAYREGQHEKAFQLLREAVQLQDNLRYDEPWGKMQPIRHALGGLLLEQGHLKEAEEVFRQDLKFHPKNPWALVGLIQCLKKKSDGGSCCNGNKEKGDAGSEVRALEAILETQRKCEWADYNVTVACECCKHS